MRSLKIVLSILAFIAGGLLLCVVAPLEVISSDTGDTTKGSLSADLVVNNDNSIGAFTERMLANQPERFVMDKYGLAVIDVPKGTKLVIEDEENAANQQFRLMDGGTEVIVVKVNSSFQASFSVRILDCPEDCPVTVSFDFQ